jgi:hypothetical protein
MDFSWWTPPHTNQVLNVLTLALMAWGIRKLLTKMRAVENAIVKLCNGKQ